MDHNKNDILKISDMIMCGDHPSFNRSQLNEKTSRPIMIQPTSTTSTCKMDQCARVVSELRGRRVRSLGAVPQTENHTPLPANRLLVQAALGSFRWPPYQLAIWVLLLVVTHTLHGLVSILGKIIPYVRKLCAYFRTWTESYWKTKDHPRKMLHQAILIFITATVYTVYFGVYLIYSVALWSVEPLCSNSIKEYASDTESNMRESLLYTNYSVDDFNSRTNIDSNAKN